MRVNKDNLLKILGSAKSGTVSISPAGHNGYISHLPFKKIEVFEGSSITFWYKASDNDKCYPHVSIDLDDITSVCEYEWEGWEPNDFGVMITLGNGIRLFLYMEDYHDGKVIRFNR